MTCILFRSPPHSSGFPEENKSNYRYYFCCLNKNAANFCNCGTLGLLIRIRSDPNDFSGSRTGLDLTHLCKFRIVVFDIALAFTVAFFQKLQLITL